MLPLRGILSAIVCLQHIYHSTAAPVTGNELLALKRRQISFSSIGQEPTPTLSETPSLTLSTSTSSISSSLSGNAAFNGTSTSYTSQTASFSGENTVIGETSDTLATHYTSAVSGSQVTGAGGGGAQTQTVTVTSTLTVGTVSVTSYVTGSPLQTNSTTVSLSSSTVAAPNANETATISNTSSTLSTSSSCTTLQPGITQGLGTTTSDGGFTTNTPNPFATGTDSLVSISGASGVYSSPSEATSTESSSLSYSTEATTNVAGGTQLTATDLGSTGSTAASAITAATSVSSPAPLLPSSTISEPSAFEPSPTPSSLNPSEFSLLLTATVGP